MTRTTKRGSVTIFEFAAIIAVVLVVGFLGFTFVNRQQQLASIHGSEPTVKPVQSTDIKPIATPADIIASASQLDTMDQELNESGDISSLDADLSALED